MPCRTLLFSIFKPDLIACYLKRCVLKMLVISWVITPTPISLLINPINPRSNTVFRAPVNVLCSCCHYFSTHRKLPLALISQELSGRLLWLCPPVSPLNLAVGLCLRNRGLITVLAPSLSHPFTPHLPVSWSPTDNSVSIHLFFLLKCWIHSCLFHNLNYFLSPRIYQSLDYIEDNATVFHAYYLSAVANAEIKNSVALGHFILPPASLQKG